MTDSIRMYKKETEEYKKLQRAAMKLTEASPRKRKYFVGNTYFDLGQGWEWTTVLCETQYGAYQALNPYQQSAIVKSESDEDIKAVVLRVLSDPHCPDKIVV